MMFFLLSSSTLADVFPAEPFNGLQVSYSISGAGLSAPKDSEGFTCYRELEGKLTGDELTVSGTASAGNGWGATIDVSVSVDGQEPKSFHQEKFPKNGLAGDVMNQQFSVTVPVPSDAKEASFTISLEGSYNAGSRGVVVEASLNRSYSMPVEETEIDAAAKTSENTYCCKGSCSYKRWWPETKSEEGSDSVLKTMPDSGARFSGLTGEVSIRPAGNEYAWRGAGLKSIINIDDHVRTGEDSRAIISFPDMTTFILNPESEVVIDAPPEKDSKIALVCGKVWTNLKKMMKDGSMEVQMSQAVAGIKGTTIVCEETGDSSTLKVLEGTASFKSRYTGEEVLIRAGEMVTATESGLSRSQSFDIETENADFGPYATKTDIAKPKESEVIYDSWNIHSVNNAPACSPVFTIDEPRMITYIDTYHWNWGKGTNSDGTISLKNGDGEIFGPWTVALESGSGVANVWWISHPDEVIPAGNYTVVDSDPDTWSWNSQSSCGFTKIEGYAYDSEAGGLATSLSESQSPYAEEVEGSASSPSSETISTPDAPSASSGLGELLYSDDFSDMNSGWARKSSDSDMSNMGYENGRYHIIRKKPGLSWSYPPDWPIFKDFAVEAETNQEDGPDNNQYGLVLRRDTSGNYYCFQVSGTGNYRFDINQKGQWTEIVPPTWSSKINVGNAKNILRVKCKGDRFTFYANGAKIGEAQDSTIPAGRIGLATGALDDQTVHISFDNLKIWAM